jgi:hypothetical protein
MSSGGVTLPSPDEQPRISPLARVLGAILWFGIPFLLLGAAVVLLASGEPVAILLILLPFILGMPAIALLCRRHGANLTGWDESHIYLASFRGEARVAWGDIEWFWKLWATHKFEGGGKAWIATLVRYRSSARSKTVLLTVTGTAADEGFGQPLFAAKYTTVFDMRIRSKNRAVSTYSRP